MKRDFTVTLSLALMAGAYGYAALTGDFEFAGDERPSLGFHLVFWPVMASALRAVVLWFQTLIDAARPKDRSPARVGWVVLHFVFGPFAAYAYYYLHPPGLRRRLENNDEALKRRANEGSL